MSSQSTTRLARAEATRAALIAAARTRFAAAGYHATSTTDVVAAAGVTRGALYHHFADKQQLFEAVLRDVADDLNMRAQAAVLAMSGDVWRQFVAALHSYLRLVADDPGLQRIMLVDGPAVLGWLRWRAVQSEYVSVGIVSTLRMLIRQGVLPRRAPEPLAGLILAALNEAALSIAHGADAREADEALGGLVQGLRVGDPHPVDDRPPLP